MRYELVDYNPETKLYRIKNIKTQQLGGWVEGTHNLSQDEDDTAWIYHDAVVCEKAFVSGNAVIQNNAKIFGHAEVYDNVCVADYAQIGGYAVIRNKALIYGKAQVFDNACVQDQSSIYGNARVFGNARVKNNAQVRENSCVSGNASIKDYVDVCGDARVFGNASITGLVTVRGESLIYGHAYLFGGQTFKHNVVIDDDYHHQINRSDGYDFMYVPCSDGKKRIIAGCRYFTMEEAYDHWGSNEYLTTRGKHLQQETLYILDFFKNIDTLDW